jgi:hypothetical protein
VLRRKSKKAAAEEDGDAPAAEPAPAAPEPARPEPGQAAESASDDASAERRSRRRDRWTVVLASVIVLLQVVTVPVLVSLTDEPPLASDNPGEPEEAEPPELESQELSGDGPGHSELFEVDGGLTVFEISHDGSGNFIVELQDKENERVTGLVNALGDFEGSTATHVPPGEYVVAVRGDSWSVSVTQPRYTEAEAPPVSFSGEGTRVTDPFEVRAPEEQGGGEGEDGDGEESSRTEWREQPAEVALVEADVVERRPVRFAITHQGEGNVRITLLDREGRRAAGVLNDFDSVDTTTRAEVKPGIYLLNVEAEGEWTIEIE